MKLDIDVSWFSWILLDGLQMEHRTSFTTPLDDNSDDEGAKLFDADEEMELDPDGLHRAKEKAAPMEHFCLTSPLISFSILDIIISIQSFVTRGSARNRNGIDLFLAVSIVGFYLLHALACMSVVVMTSLRRIRYDFYASQSVHAGSNVVRLVENILVLAGMFVMKVVKSTDEIGMLLQSIAVVLCMDCLLLLWILSIICWNFFKLPSIPCCCCLGCMKCEPSNIISLSNDAMGFSYVGKVFIVMTVVIPYYAEFGGTGYRPLISGLIILFAAMFKLFADCRAPKSLSHFVKAFMLIMTCCRIVDFLVQYFGTVGRR